MNKIFAIAKNTFRETIRDKILYGILAFAVLFIVGTVILGSLSLGEDLKIIRDFGLAGIYLFGLIITVFIGASVMHREISQRTIYLLLSKPVSAIEVVVGKFLGLLTGAGTAVLLMAAVYITVVAVNGGGLDFISLIAIGLQLGEMAIFIAAAIFFSLLSTPLASIIYSVCIAYIGHSLDLLLKFSQTEPQQNAILRWGAESVYYLFPNLEKFNIRDLVVYQKIISPEVFLAAIIYAVLYASLLLYLSANILKRKEL